MTAGAHMFCLATNSTGGAQKHGQMNAAARGVCVCAGVCVRVCTPLLNVRLLLPALTRPDRLLSDRSESVKVGVATGASARAAPKCREDVVAVSTDRADNGASTAPAASACADPVVDVDPRRSPTCAPFAPFAAISAALDTCAAGTSSSTSPSLSPSWPCRLCGWLPRTRDPPSASSPSSPDSAADACDSGDTCSDATPDTDCSSGDAGTVSSRDGSPWSPPSTADTDGGTHTASVVTSSWLIARDAAAARV